jgi:hypothetical protein
VEEVGIEQVRQIGIKGYNSPSLPIYNFLAPQEVQLYLDNRDAVLQREAETENGEEKKN